ncbi:MAG: hypothetical protein V4697_02340 [Patescibacteria group bacterium]
MSSPKKNSQFITWVVPWLGVLVFLISATFFLAVGGAFIVLFSPILISYLAAWYEEGWDRLIKCPVLTRGHGSRATDTVFISGHFNFSVFNSAKSKNLEHLYGLMCLSTSVGNRVFFETVRGPIVTVAMISNTENRGGIPISPLFPPSEKIFLSPQKLQNA